ARRDRLRACRQRLRPRARVASVAAGPRSRVGPPLDDAERLPRPRASELDPQLRSVRASHCARKAGARDRGTVVRGNSEVRIMRSRAGRAGLAGRSGGAGLIVTLLLATSPASAATKAIRAGRVVDASGKVLTNVVIVVDNDRITSVGTSPPPPGAEVIDLSRYTIVPGLIDLHTHMTYYWDRAPGTRPLGQPRRPAGVTTVLAAENARLTLETGVTTVRDLGAANEVDYAMRDLINPGKMVGPRMFVAGQGLSAPRGGGAPNPDGYRQQAEARVVAGSDWVKVYGSRGSYQSVDTTQTLTFDEMKAAVDA